VATDDYFGGFEGTEEEIERFQVKDVDRHIKYLKARFLTPEGTWNFNKQVTLPMERGEWITLKNGKRRGSTEYDNEQSFREAARQLKLGIKFARPVYYRGAEDTRMAGLDMTDLRFKVETQREFTEEAVLLRTLAQAVDLMVKWRDATPETVPPGTDIDQKRKEAKVRLDNNVATARKLNTEKTRDALVKHGIPVSAPRSSKE
jgi:hypothetical protein